MSVMYDQMILSEGWGQYKSSNLSTFWLCEHFSFLPKSICLTMKISSIVFTISALATVGMAAKTCTPSFDYCSDVLIKDKGNWFPVWSCCAGLNKSTGFTEADLKDVLKGSDLEKEDLENILFHCKNPGDVGHPKLCQSGCKDPSTEGSHSCWG